MAAMQRHITLVSPPFWYAVHGPPLALPCLAGFLEQEGFSVRVVDLNIRLIHDAELRRLALEAARTRLEALDEQDRLSDSEQAEYTRLVGLLVRGPSPPLQNERLDFFLAYFEPLWQQGISIPDLDRIAREDPRCVYRERLRAGLAEWLLPGSLALGISVACAEQLLGALTLAHVVKELMPQLPVILGGSVFSLVSPATAREVVSLPYVDYLVRHEGERPLGQLCRALAGELDLHSVPNLLFRSGAAFVETAVCEPIHPRELPVPDFQDLLENPYQEPVRIPVLQTRGCYWGKCTFCDIHLYVSGSRSYRHDDPARLAEQIHVLRQRHGRDRFEIVTTAMSPSYARRFSQALLEAGVSVDWETRIKYEAQFDEELFRSMALAGCRHVSLGVESVNARVLALMDKGDYDREKVERLLRSAKRAGIETIKIWLIPDFPTTTWEEASEYEDFLQANRDVLDVVHVFNFHALEHTPIANDAARFGLRLSAERERSVFGLHALQFEPSRGMSRAEGRAMAAHLRRRWSELSGGSDGVAPPVDARALLVGRLRLRGPVRITRLRHLPEASLLVSAPGEVSTLVRPAAEPLLTALGERESFDLADALSALERPGAIPRGRLVVQTVETLASLMQVGVLSEAAPSGGHASPLHPSPRPE